MISINQFAKAIYATYLTNKFGFKARAATSSTEIKQLRIEYATTLLSKLNISVSVTGKEKLNNIKQCLLISNHSSVIDPLIIEIALIDTAILGRWISKKELYNSFFFGVFVRNAGSILLDRSANHLMDLFTDIKSTVSQGDSVFIFPEGSRNRTQNTLTEFKKGSGIIARKSKLDILPVFIKTNANDVLMRSLTSNEKNLVIEIEIGDVIAYTKKPQPLEKIYKTMFGIN